MSLILIIDFLGYCPLLGSTRQNLLAYLSNEISNGSETVHLKGFPCTIISCIYREYLKKEKKKNQRKCLVWSHMSEKNGQTTSSLQERDINLNTYSLEPKFGKGVSEHTRFWTSKRARTHTHTRKNVSCYESEIARIWHKQHESLDISCLDWGYWTP